MRSFGKSERALGAPDGTGGRPRRRRVAAFGGAAACAALLLGACGSSPSSNGTTTTTSTSSTTTTTPANPQSQLATYETNPSSSVPLLETGSTLLYPLFSAWSTGLKSTLSNISLTTAGTGSGTGISDAISGTVDIGASDAYLPPADLTSDPGIENIPLAISAQQVNYNVPLPAGTHLKLNGTILAEMYTGKITNWNDSAIAALNPGVTLPNLAVHPLHRSDGSGDTFLFSTYLYDSAPSIWGALGYNTTISWPTVANEAAYKGNSGMVQGCGATSGCVAYIGISYLSKTQSAGLGEAMLQNKSGNYELPTAATIVAEAASFTNVPANGSISLIYGPASGGYPIINFEYAIVYPSKLGSKAAAVQAVLAWGMDPTNGSASSYLSTVNFQPLPPGALAVAVALLKNI